MNDQAVQWFDFDLGYGEIDTGEKVYRYVPSGAGDLEPDEWSRVAVVDDGVRYVCRSYWDGGVSCSCGGSGGNRCEHLRLLSDYGIVKELEPVPADVKTPW